MNKANPAHHSDSLATRLSFMGLDAEASARLRDLKPEITKAIGPALDVFYSRVRKDPHTAPFFRNEQHIAHAKTKQEEHWSVISSADFGAEYERRVRTIGQTHARLGLEPRWYIGGYALALEQIIGAVVAAQWPSRWQTARTPEPMSRSIAVLVKAAMLDMDLSISTYLEALDERRREAERARELDQERQSAALSALSDALERLASGDLTGAITLDLAPEFAGLKANFNGTLAKLHAALSGVRDGAETIAAGTQQISNAADDLSKRTEQQAASLEQTAAALDEITATVRKAAAGAQHAQELVTVAKQNAERAGGVVQRAVAAMGAIEKSSTQINQIIGVIDEIAFQTNLLALNAGVEAARAGDAGRGFAVVASEVRALAQRSAEAAKEIKGLLTASTAQVADGVTLVGETGKALERIMTQVLEISGEVANIASGAKEQSTGLAEVNMAMNQMDQTTQQNAAMVEETTAASHALAQKTAELNSLIATFRLGTNQGLGPSRTPEVHMHNRGAKAAIVRPNKPSGRTRTALNALNAAETARDEGWSDF